MSAVLIVAFLVWQRPSGTKLVVLFVSAVMGLSAFYLPYRQSQIASQVPPIHDITTDTVNPPAFVAIAPIRAAAPNPVTYEGEAIASQQREAYPDIMTMTFTEAPASVYNAVLEVVDQMGWELVDANENEGRVEATDTTRWFGFKDDVVIRIQPGPAESTMLDVRSKSRVGRSDIGMNARRIRAFTSSLNNTVGGS